MCVIIKSKCLETYDEKKVGKCMIYSMTGYGKCEIEENARKISVEISAVNHRYLDLNIRMPRMLMHLEDQVRGIIKQEVARGKLEVSIMCHSSAKEDLEVNVNEALGSAYLEGVRHFGSKFNLEDDLRLSHLIGVSDLVTIQKQAGNLEAVGETIEKALRQALKAFLEMRQKEGQALKEDILSKNEGLRALLAAVNMRSPFVVTHYRERLKSRLEQLLGDGMNIDESRLAMEVALLADKSAIDEEITRLSSHFNQLEDILTMGGPVGRKLDFLMQEMNREANTIGSKANDYEITKVVVSLKTEIEKIREQVQNLE